MNEREVRPQILQDFKELYLTQVNYDSELARMGMIILREKKKEKVKKDPLLEKFTHELTVAYMRNEEYISIQLLQGFFEMGVVLDSIHGDLPMTKDKDLLPLKDYQANIILTNPALYREEYPNLMTWVNSDPQNDLELDKDH